MDDELHRRLAAIGAQIEKLHEVEKNYLTLEAHRKVLYSEMFRKSVKTSVADREAEAYDSETWITFSRCLAEQEALFNKERRNYELKLKAFDGSYLSLKTDSQAIRRGVGGEEFSE